MKTPAWKRMSSGKYIDLNNFRPEDVDIGDIETSLNNIIRFTGHGKDQTPLSVAQHSLLCLHMAEIDEPDNYELHIRTFIHDFEEAYVGDVATPVKKMLGQTWKDFVNPIRSIVEESFIKGEASQDMVEQVKSYDAMSLDIERRSLWNNQTGKAKWPPITNPGTLATKQKLFQWAALHMYVPVEEIYNDLKERYDLSLLSQPL